METDCPPVPVLRKNYAELNLEFGQNIPQEVYDAWVEDFMAYNTAIRALDTWHNSNLELRLEAMAASLREEAAAKDALPGEEAAAKDALLKSEAEAMAASLREEAAAKDALPGEEAAAEEPVVNEADGPLQAGGTAARSKRIRWSCRSIKSTWAIKGTWPIKSTARRLVLFGLAVKLIQAVHALAIRRMY